MGTAQTEAVCQSALKRLSPQKDSLASALYVTSRLVAAPVFLQPFVLLCRLTQCADECDPTASCVLWQHLQHTWLA